MRGYFLADQERSGSENMAVDQAMLEHAEALGLPLVRTYQWQEPTLSLGYFQKLRDRANHAESVSCELIRRSTGGGAILHHFDWTYSVAIPSKLIDDSAGKSSKTTGAARALYDAVHDEIVRLLTKIGFAASKWAEPAACDTPQRGQGCAFLCFERRSEGDIVVDGAKVMGSAQRRYKNTVLQHGSLLLARSTFAPSLAGLRELEGDASCNRS
jgi:lipoate-protein ligase A